MDERIRATPVDFQAGFDRHVLNQGFGKHSFP
jgi:hypothetical protein